MARFLLLFSGALLFSQVKSQIIRNPLSLLNRPFTETIIEAPRNYIEAPCAYADAPRNYIEAPRTYADASRNYIEAPRTYTDAPRNLFDIPIDAGNYINVPRIIEAPRNYFQTPTIIPEAPCNGIAPNILGNAPSTTIITDCTPSVCQNLANTINLMIVSNLLQNTIGGDQAALQFAGPLLKDLLSNSAPAGGIPKSSFNPNLIAPNGYAPNLVAPNVFAPNFLPQNLVATNLGAPNFVAPNLVVPNAVAPKLVASNMFGPSTAPRVVASPFGSSNEVVSSNAPANSAALVSSLLQLLGSPV